MKTYELKNINVLSLAVTMGFFMGILGVLYSTVCFFALNEESKSHLRYLIILTPLLLVPIGFVTGAFYAWVINLATKHVKSIQFTVSEISESKDMTI